MRQLVSEYLNLNQAGSVLQTVKQQTLGFQNCMQLYKADKKNELPKELQNNEMVFIDAINLILELQNNNLDYEL